MGTWIEIKNIKMLLMLFIVVPLVGTWIEIQKQPRKKSSRKSCPSWARGLKYRQCDSLADRRKSCPSWARGLKYSGYSKLQLQIVVPLVGTWIEIDHPGSRDKRAQSCPSWARGLKCHHQHPARTHLRRAPRGHVD